MAEDQDKTEQPTERKRSKALEKGDVARSKDLTSSVSLFFSILMFAILMPNFIRITLDFQKKYFSRVAEIDITPSSVNHIARDFALVFLKLVGPVVLLVIIVVLVMEMYQGKGFHFISENVRIKWEKVMVFGEFTKGLKKILVSPQALMELAKSIVKVTAIGYIAYLIIRSEIPMVMELPKTTIANIMTVMGRLFLKLSLYITLFLFVLAVADFMWQKFQHLKRLKMTKQDVKEEFKQTEGDPLIKGRQRKLQYQQAMRRMMAEVPHADVVITNPTHYAVALKYEYKVMKSPQLVAKGKDLIAERIKALANENNVPVVENPPVARAVFASVEVNEYIPADLFRPIAEILAYIYKLKGKRIL